MPEIENYLINLIVNETDKVLNDEEIFGHTTEVPFFGLSSNAVTARRLCANIDQRLDNGEKPSDLIAGLYSYIQELTSEKNFGLIRSVVHEINACHSKRGIILTVPKV